MEQENIANRISMCNYWRDQKAIVCLYLRNYNYEHIHCFRIIKCYKSPKTGIWYAVIATMSHKILHYRVDDIILIRKTSPTFTTLDLICYGRKKLWRMRKKGRLS